MIDKIIGSMTFENYPSGLVHSDSLGISDVCELNALKLQLESHDFHVTGYYGGKFLVNLYKSKNN